jgi:hypothetical protein
VRHTTLATPRLARLHLAARLFPVGTQTQPTAEVLDRRPFREVASQFAYQRQSVDLVGQNQPLDGSRPFGPLPHCGVDAVIGSESIYHVTYESLRQMEAHWFQASGTDFTLKDLAL